MKKISFPLIILTVLLTLVACKTFDQVFGGNSAVEVGNQALADKKYNEAITEFTKAIKDSPDDATLYYLRGSAYYARYNDAFLNNDPKADGNDFRLAIDDFNKAIEIDPNYAEAYDFRGLTYAAFEEDDKALSDYNQAIALKPDLASAYYGRGFLYEENGQYDLAIADYERFLELSNDAYWRTEAEKRLEDLRSR